MKNIVVILFAIVFSAQVFAESKEVKQSLEALDNVLERRKEYFDAHAQRIDSLKIISHKIPVANSSERYNRLHDIFTEYSSFQGDSAHHYARLAFDAAFASGNADNIAMARTDLIFTNLSSGNFTDAVDEVNHTDLRDVADDIKTHYYYTCIRLFSDLAAFTNDESSEKYRKLSEAYCDSVMQIASPDSYEYRYALAFSPKSEHTPQHRLQIFKQLLHRDDIDLRTKAMMSSMVADAFRDLNITDSMIVYKALAAKLDTESAKRETIATIDLANIMFEQGDIERAYRYMDYAREDADFYNMRSRKVEITRTLPLIEKSRYFALDSRRRDLMVTAIVFVVMALLLTVAIIFIIRQLKKTRRLQAETLKKSDELEHKNRELEKTVSRLKESNNVRDEYIGYGFALNADYLRKIESLYNMVDRRLMMKQYEELRRSLKRGDLRKDKEEMLTQFDKTFLRLFPDFVEKWKALFPEDDSKNAESDGSSLTSEMRIFALIRLGITEVSDISLFLGYSVNTVNTYKTKAKNRSFVANEKFESTVVNMC